MKTIVFLILLLCATAKAQTYSVELTNVTVVGGVTVVGDPLPVAFSKLNTNDAALFQLVTNLQSQIDTNNVTVSNLNLTAVFLSSVVVTNNGTNFTIGGTFSGVGTNLSIHGGNLVPATVNTNSFDAVTLAKLCEISLTDSGASTGSAGQFPVAAGGGAWNWTAANVVADTGGNGGTTLKLKASDDGSDVYIHVTSAGVITATASP